MAILASLVMSPSRGFLTNCSLAETFGLLVSKTESNLSLIWVNDIFTRLHPRRMVRRGTSITAGPTMGLSFQTPPACLALYLKHPFMSHLVRVSEARQPYSSVWTCLCFSYSPEGKIIKVLGEKKGKEYTFRKKLGVLSWIHLAFHYWCPAIYQD